ncbi:MAG: M1 family peptidase [Bacteroidetes bacterium]|nr:MAG: M1 family peptidase [Bacteroidota bacterium]
MKLLSFWCLSILLLFDLPAAAQSYFQQALDYQITVRLDDQRHELHGEWTLTYTNNSPDTLHFLYLHLWPNAYSSKRTALARQLLRQGKTDFYFAPLSNLGGIDSLAFRQDEHLLQNEATTYGPDVIKLPLASALLPGKSSVLRTPFRLRIPPSLSRLGHVGQAYQLTQWYPKPAVYDRAGWHPMPYLDQGEFYSEFGRFTIHISLPQNYVVAATGVLQNARERKWLLDKAQSSRSDQSLGQALLSVDSFPPSAPTTKTLTYVAEDVHDFAWFADKRLQLRHDTLQLAGRKTPVDVWAFFTTVEAELWAEATTYMKRATRFYSEQIGVYPYPQVSAVQCPGSAGAGMEYPMITLIGREYTAPSLDGVLTHEIGHNWFYGILGSNERDHAWMDEGFNSYYDHRYADTYYPDKGKTQRLVFDQAAYRYYNITGRAQAPATTSGQLRAYNYWTGAYTIPALALRQLAQYLGEGRFRTAMQAYYEEWKFRHPQPADLQRSLEASTKEDLDWFFAGFMQSIEQQDYRIVGVKEVDGRTRLTIRNRGRIAAPFPVQAGRAGAPTDRVWTPGFTGIKTLVLPGTSYDYLAIDPEQLTLEVQRQDNWWRARGLLPRLEPLRLFSFTESGRYTSLLLFPLPLYNRHDGLQAGIGLSNRTLLPRSFEWLLAPAYGVGSNRLVGFAGAQQRWWPRRGRIREIALQGSYRSFHFRTFATEGLPLRYQRFSPGLRLSLQPSRKRQWTQQFHWRSIFLRQDRLRFDAQGNRLPLDQTDQWIHELSYTFERPQVLAPFSGGLYVEQSRYVDPFGREQTYVKARFELEGSFMYEQNRSFHWRIFVGRFLSNSLRQSNFLPENAFSLFDRGRDDYRYDNLYLDRSAGEDWGRQQLAQRAGGLRAPLPANFGLGRSNKSIVSLNLSLDLPFTPDWLPLKPYLDAASYALPASTTVDREFLWVGGLALEWLDGKLGVYAPLFGTDRLMDRLAEQGGLAQRIAVRVNFRDLMPWRWIDNQDTW